MTTEAVLATASNVIAVSSLVVAAASLFIAWSEYRRNNMAVLKFEWYSRVSYDSHYKNGKMHSEFGVKVLNLGRDLHDISVAVCLYDEKKGTFTFGMTPKIQIGGVFFRGMMAEFVVKSCLLTDSPPVRLGRFGTPSSCRFSVLVHSQGYLVKRVTWDDWREVLRSNASRWLCKAGNRLVEINERFSFIRYRHDSPSLRFEPRRSLDRSAKFFLQYLRDHTDT
ncbi:MAG: hypothetical protein ACFHWZ_07760 [Phycisphaerales bacterium]